jgi:hypothetical protein
VTAQGKTCLVCGDRYFNDGHHAEACTGPVLPVVHVTALTIKQMRACLRALADTAGVYVVDMIADEDPPSHLTENEWSTVVVLKDVHRRACLLEGVSPVEGWGA